MAKLEGVKTIDMTNGEITKIAYDGEEYTKVDGLPKVGDITRETMGGYNVTNGAFYEVIALDELGDPRFEDNNHEYNGVFLGRKGVVPNEYYRKSPAAVSPPFAEMLTAKIDAVGAKVSAVASRVAALESAKGNGDTPLKAGDRVKALSDGEDADIMAGEYGVVVSKGWGDYDDHFDIFVESEDTFDYFRPQDLELVTEEQPKPVVGDIVVITANMNSSRNEVGDIGKVVEAEDNANVAVSVEVPGRTEKGYPRNYTKFTEMRLATPTEIKRYFEAVEEAKRVEAQAAEREAKDAVFTKAGRKPNEYRKGDLVRYLGKSSKHGRLAEVEEDGSDSRVRINMDGISTEHPKELEIVCFAEDRADIAKGGR